MTLRKIRQSAYQKLGFLPFEARRYANARIPITNNGVVALMVKARKNMWDLAGRPNFNSVKWERTIRLSYDAKDKEFGNGNDAMGFYRDWEKEWQSQHKDEKIPDKWQPRKSTKKPEQRRLYRELNKEYINKKAREYKQSEHGKKVRREYAQQYRLKKRNVH